MEPVLVRDATPDDVPAIAAIHVDAWNATYAGILPPKLLKEMSVDVREREWRKVLDGRARPRRVRLVAELDGTVVGFAAAGPARDPGEADHTAELAVLYLLDSAQGRGVGTALVAASERGLAGHGFADAMLWVHRDNVRACAFYDARGWALDGGERDFEFRGFTVPEVRFRRRLEPGGVA